MSRRQSRLALTVAAIAGIMIVALHGVHLNPAGSIPSHLTPHTIVLGPA
jgi:hypothetical protein